MTSFDELPSSRPTTVHRNSSAGSNSKASSYLPIPSHTRAASTPVQTESTRSDLVAHHRRFPSSVDTSTKQITSDPGFRKDSKKFSLDSSRAEDRLSKRASSETNDKLSKRNSSSPAAVSLLASPTEKVQHKRSLDEMKLSQNHRGQQSKSHLKATPELLAELLKGSSEKMVTAEQRHKSHHSSNALPSAVLRCLVSVIWVQVWVCLSFCLRRRL